MITPAPYDQENFSPIIIDDVEVSRQLIDLASLSPTFSPTPPPMLPPNGFHLHQELLSFKKSLSWKLHFRKQELQKSESLEDFIKQELSVFKKLPWYTPSNREPPPLPQLLEVAFQNFYSSMLDPKTWTKTEPNLSVDLLKALKSASKIQSNNVGIYLQDKSSRIVFASLEKTNDKIENVLSDATKYRI